MSGLFSYGTSTTQRTGNDAIYGQGTDGDVTISSNTALTSDKYYNNLIVNSGVTVFTTGYKIFVKNTLILNGTIIASQYGTIPGTILAGTKTSNVSNVLGGIGAGSSANSAPSWVTENIYGLVLDSSPIHQPSFSDSLLTVYGEANENTTLTLTAPGGSIFNEILFMSYGTPTGSAGSYTINNSCHATLSDEVKASLLGQSTLTVAATNAVFGDPCPFTAKKLAVVAKHTSPVLTSVRGGSAGIAGSTGSTTAALTNFDTWSGRAGTAGSVGNYSPNANTEGASGGKGYTGNSGTATGATAGAGGAGGPGGPGGALVVIVAKYITGTGVIQAFGGDGELGSGGSTGNPGTAGNTGATAPTLTVNAGTNSTAVIAGCNNHTSPVNTANCVTHGHVGGNHHYNVQSNSHHTYCTTHGHGGNCNAHGHIRSTAHHTEQQHHTTCNVHNSTHANHICNTHSSYAGGAGGAGGAAAPAVTGNQGQVGYNGGGGAIILVTEPFIYFEVAPVGVEVTRTWATGGNQTTVVSGADGTAIGTGAQNTVDIVNQSGNVAATSAAVYCSDLVFGGKSDWFLPSKDELNQMYVNGVALGGFLGDLYWSSSEFDAHVDFARYQYFGNGYQGNSFKDSTFYVRPVRSFSSEATYAIGDTGPAGGKIFITPSTSPLLQITTTVAAGTGGTGVGGAGNVYVILNK